MTSCLTESMCLTDGKAPEQRVIDWNTIALITIGKKVFLLLESTQEHKKGSLDQWTWLPMTPQLRNSLLTNANTEKNILEKKKSQD